VSGSRTRLRIVARDGAQHAFEIAGYGELEPLLASVRAQGIEIADIELERPDLEAVFLRMTGKGQDK
jgi:hypothetical protein